MSFVEQPWRFCRSLTLAVLVCGGRTLVPLLGGSRYVLAVLQTSSRSAVLLLCTPSEMGTMFQAKTKREFFFQA